MTTSPLPRTTPSPSPGVLLLVVEGRSTLVRVSEATVPLEDVADARAMQLPSTGHWQLVETFHRSPLIYRKHNTAVLYRWEKDVD